MEDYSTGSSSGSFIEKFASFFGNKVRDVIGEKAFQYWFHGVDYSICDQSDTLTIKVTNERFEKHIRRNYLCKIHEVCAELWRDRAVKVNLLAHSKREDLFNNTNNVVRVDFGFEQYGFSNFIPDSSNIAALSVAKSVACYEDNNLIEPGTILYIHGDVGRGKTHLCRAITEHYHNIDGRVAYFSSEEFTAKFVSSVRTNTLFEFKESILTQDILIVDDLHFLFGKKATLEELTNLACNMLDRGKYVILATTLPPAKLSLSQRLQSRIFAGVLVEMEKPSTELKQKVVMRCAMEKKLPLDLDAMNFIACHVTGDIRDVIGAMNRLNIASSTHGYKLDIPTVSGILADMLNRDESHGSGSLDMEGIKDVVCHHYGIAPHILISRSRIKSIVKARSLVMYLARHILQLSYTEIAANLGIKHHATVLHGLKKASDERFISEALLLERKLRKGCDAPRILSHSTAR